MKIFKPIVRTTYKVNGKKLRALIKKKGYSLTKLSKECGISAGFLCDLLLGNRTASEKTKNKIVKVLNIEEGI